MDVNERAYDAIFQSRLGVDGIYRASDGDTPCRLVRHDPDAKNRPNAGYSFGGVPGRAERIHYLLVRRKQVARPVSGAAFVIGEGADAVTWRIGEDDPIDHDDAGHVWRCAVVKEF